MYVCNNVTTDLFIHFYYFSSHHANAVHPIKELLNSVSTTIPLVHRQKMTRLKTHWHWLANKTVSVTNGTKNPMTRYMRTMYQRSVPIPCTKVAVDPSVQGKRPLGRPRHRWEDNIQMDLQRVGWRVWAWSILLRLETGGGNL